MYKTIRRTTRNVLVLYSYLDKDGTKGTGKKIFDITLSNQHKKLNDNEKGRILQEMINGGKGKTYTDVQFFLLEEKKKYKYY